MPGILTIAKKEFTDHVSDQTFLLCFAVLIIAILSMVYYWVDFFQSNLLLLPSQSQNNLNISTIDALRDYPQIIPAVASPLSSLGILVAIALGFNSINKERSDGSLKVLLSYPIYRDKIILGKILAGILVITIVSVASMTISFSILFYYMAIPLTLDIILRLATATLFGILLLTFFLFLAIAVSTTIRDTTTCIVMLLLTVCIFQPSTITNALVTVDNLLTNFGFTQVISLNIGNIFYSLNSWVEPMPFNDVGARGAFFRFYSNLSPVTAYHYILNILAQDTWDSLAHLIIRFQTQAAILIFFTITAFIVSYIIFTRQDLT